MLLISFLMAALQLSLSFSIGQCHASWNVLGSVGPDVTTDIRQVSWIQSSIFRSALSMDSFVGEDISLVSLQVFPSVSSLAPIMLMSMPNFFCVSALFLSLLDFPSSSSMELSRNDLSSSDDFSSLSKKIQLAFFYRCSYFCSVSR